MYIYNANMGKPLKMYTRGRRKNWVRRIGYAEMKQGRRES